MQIKAKPVYKEWLFIIIAWIVLMYLYYFTAVYGTIHYWKPGVIKDYVGSWESHIELWLQGIFFGLLFALINYTFDKSSIRKRSFGFIITIKSLLYIFAMIIVGAFINLVYLLFDIGPYEKLVAQTLETISIPLILSFLLYITFSIILINFIIQVSRKFGPGNLKNIILGKYHVPQIEERIFLFLDLKSSTTIAEKLGHHKYSQLIQSCFQDLTDIVIRYKAEIYQYVGDEVVFSWSLQDGLKNVNCIKSFFAYALKLGSRRNYYEQKYGVFPEFRGGMDLGRVTVAEVGEIKREIAYHGDVLNTASRLQEQCKHFDKRLLISEHLAERLPSTNGFEQQLIGELKLRGKSIPVNVYALELI